MEIKRLRPFKEYEFDYEQSWLNQLAEQGYLLTGRGLLTYRFTRSDNNRRRYSVIPKDYNDFSEDELELYNESGWTFLSEDSGKCIFYTDDPDAVDLFTDQESYRQYLRKTLRQFLRDTCLCILVVAVYLGNLWVIWPGNKNGLETLAERTLGDEISHLSIIVFIIILNAEMATGYFLCRRRILGKGKNADAIWGRGRTFLRTILPVLGLVCCIAVGYSLIFSSSQVKGDALENYQDPCPVRFCEFDPEGWEFVSDHLGPIKTNAGSGVRFDYSLYHTSNLALKDGYEESFYASETMCAPEEDEKEYPEYTSLTYDFCTEELAERLLQRQIGGDQGEPRDSAAIQKIMAEMVIQVPGTDYAGYYEDQTGSYMDQYLYLRKGCRVVYVHYYGDKSIKNKLSLFAAQ